jgi:hypothetical protein
MKNISKFLCLLAVILMASSCAQIDKSLEKWKTPVTSPTASTVVEPGTAAEAPKVEEVKKVKKKKKKAPVKTNS